MDNLESLRPLLGELERYVEWAAPNWNLPISERVVVVVQTKGKRKVLGHFQEFAWQTRDGKGVHEISLSAEDLHRPPVDVLETLHHELVHLLNQQVGIRDCSKSGRHNRQYASSAKQCGLDVAEPSKKYGHAHTTYSPALLAAVEDGFQPDTAAFTLARQIVQPKAAVASKYVKWICPDGCETVARAKPEVRLICGVCQAEMVSDT